MDFEKLQKAWRDFGDIPINEEEETEEEFSLNGQTFEAGTDKYVIWHEFDALCPNNLVKDLMYNSGLLTA